MFKYISIILILFFQLNVRASELIKVAKKDSETFQDSAFVKLMARFNGGTIPYPFEKLLDSFGTGEKEQGAVLFIPKGRSLVKESADYHNPRIIASPLTGTFSLEQERTEEQKKWDSRKDFIEKELKIVGGDLFIGFAPNHKALEIISYNPKKPGYDFFIVENYEEGKKPKIVHNPSLCLSCHQNNGPIFPRVGWNELLGESAKLAFGPNRDSFENEMMERVKAANPNREKIEGILLDNPSRFSTLQVATFDTAVRSGNGKLISNEFCAALCKKNDRKCQNVLISESLKKTPNYALYDYFKDLKRKLNSIKISSSVIPNRDPYTNKAIKNFITKRSIKKATELGVGDFKSFASSIGVDEQILREGVDKNKIGYDVSYNVIEPAEEEIVEDDLTSINPATIRPMNDHLLKILYNIDREKSVNEKIKMAVDACFSLSTPGTERNYEAIPVDLFNRSNIQDAFKFWPDTDRLRSEILKELENSSTSFAKDDCAQKALVPILEVYQYSALNKIVSKFNNDKIKKPEAFFGKYCIQCHGGPSAFIPLPLGSAENMANYSPKFGTSGVKERLEMKVMPPKGYPMMPSSKERAEIVKIMRELKK